VSNYGQYPMFLQTFLKLVDTSWSQILMSPDEPVISPVNILKVVVLPAPLIPSKAKQSPYSSENDTFLVAMIGFVDHIL